MLPGQSCQTVQLLYYSMFTIIKLKILETVEPNSPSSRSMTVTRVFTDDTEETMSIPEETTEEFTEDIDSDDSD